MADPFQKNLFIGDVKRLTQFGNWPEYVQPISLSVLAFPSGGGNSSSRIYTSVDGQTWENSDVSIGSSVQYNSGIFLPRHAVKDGVVYLTRSNGVLLSTVDYITYTPVAVNSIQDVVGTQFPEHMSIFYDGFQLLAIGRRNSSNITCWTSTNNGIDWVKAGENNIPTDQLYSVLESSTRYIVVGVSSNSTRICAFLKSNLSIQQIAFFGPGTASTGNVILSNGEIIWSTGLSYTRYVENNLAIPSGSTTTSTWDAAGLSPSWSIITLSGKINNNINFAAGIPASGPLANTFQIGYSTNNGSWSPCNVIPVLPMTGFSPYRCSLLELPNNLGYACCISSSSQERILYSANGITWDLATVNSPVNLISVTALYQNLLI